MRTYILNCQTGTYSYNQKSLLIFFLFLSKSFHCSLPVIGKYQEGNQPASNIPAAFRRELWAWQVWKRHIRTCQPEGSRASVSSHACSLVVVMNPPKFYLSALGLERVCSLVCLLVRWISPWIFEILQNEGREPQACTLNGRAISEEQFFKWRTSRVRSCGWKDIKSSGKQVVCLGETIWRPYKNDIKIC